MKNCGICYTRANHTTDCGHDFCIRCLQHWSHIQNSKLTCPICRQKIIIPDYPNTRTHATELQVLEILQNLFLLHASSKSFTHLTDIFEYIWVNRVVFRSHPVLRQIIPIKIDKLTQIWKKSGTKAPPVFKKFLNF